MKAPPRRKQRIAGIFRHASITLLFFYATTSYPSSQEGSEAPTVTEPPRIYRSPEERREAGLGRELTQWLTVSGLAEAETRYQENDFQSEISNASRDETSLSIQLGLDATFSDLINAELVLEYEIDKDHGELDEAVINLETETWGLSAGRQYVPFGEYYSHFVIGPMLEFGETRAEALTIGYSYGDVFELLAFVFDGDAGKAGDGDDALDWGLGIAFSSNDEAIEIGASYLSDLAETDESLLEDYNNVYQQRVAGWSAYALVGMDTFEITAEIVRAIHSFAEFETNANQPWAFDVELAYFPQPSLQFAIRIEASDELEDEPQRQYGISATWRIGKHINLAADYLFGEFKDGFVFDDDDNELDSRSQVAAQLSIEF